MKKLLSIIVTVAMLLSCMVPALSVSAADAKSAGLELAVENVTFDPNSRDEVLTAKATVSIVNNPGFAEAAWYLYATNTEMTITEVKDVQNLAEGENGLDIEVGYNKSTTLGTAVKNAFSAAGVATGSTLKTAVISMVTADGASDVTYTGDILEVTFEIAKDKAEIVEGDAFTFGLIPGVDGACYNVDGDEVVFAPITRTVTAYTDPNAPEYADKQFDNFTFFVDDVVVKPGVDTVTVGVGFGGTNADFEKYGLLSVEIGFIYPESFKIIECVKGTALDPAATETAVQELTEGSSYYVVDAPERIQNDVFAPSGYNSAGKTDKYVYQVHFSTGDDNPSYEGGYINYFTFDVSGAEPGTYELPLVTEGTVMGYNADASYKYIEWTADYDLDAGHVTITAEELPCTHENKTTTTVDATCTEPGSITVTCDDCGEALLGDVIDPKGHVAGEKYTVVAPTYESEGMWQIDCSVCGEKLESGSIDKLVPTASATVTLGDAVAYVGEQAMVELAIDGSDYFIAIFDVTYDAAVLDFVEFAHDLDAYVLVTETAEGTVRIYIEATADANLAAGVAGALVFDTLEFGKAYVAIDVVDLVDYEAGDIDNTAAGATVKVVNPGSIVVGDADVEVEETVKVPVSVENNTGIWTGRVEIAYDATALEFVEIESALFAAVKGENYSVADGVITIFLEAADMNNVTADGALFNVVFAAGDVATTTEVCVEIVDLINVNGEDLDYSVVCGHVTVTPCSHKNTTTTKVDPTVDADGSITVTCDKCGEVLSVEVIPALTAIYVESEAAEVVESTWVYVSIKNNPGFWAARLEITLGDGLALEDVHGYVCDMVEGENYSVNGNVVTVFVEADDLANYYGEEIVALAVNAKTAGTYDVDVKILDLINVDGEDINASVTGGTVTFTACTHREEYIAEEKVDATADAEGYIKTYCGFCGETISTVVLPKLASIFVEAGTSEVFDPAVAFINIKNNPGIWATRLEITVGDAANYEVLSGNLFELVEGENYSIDGNVITVFLDSADMANVEGDGTLVAIEFYSETVCAVDVDVKVLDLINVDGDDITAVVTGGTVEFTACTHAETHEERVEPTPEADGYINTVCSKCGEILDTVVIPKSASLVVEDGTAEVGEIAAVNVALNNNPGIWAARLAITFDGDAEFAGLASKFFALVEGENYSVDGNVITVFIENEEIANYVGDYLFTAYFTSDVAGDVNVDVEVIDLINVDGDDVDATVVNGKVTFTACTHSCETYEERVDATADAEGYINTVCAKCGHVISTVVIPKLAVIRPTCGFAEAGKDVYVDIETLNTPGAWAYRLEITFDELLTFKGVDSGLFAIDETNYSVDGNVITLFIENAAKEDITADGKLFGLIFSTAYSANGTAGISVKVVEVINYAGEDVEFAAEDLQLTFEGHQCTPAEGVIENAVDATCTTGGYYEIAYYCAQCGVEISREPVTTPALGHTPGEEVIENEVAADCTTDGSYDTVVYCTVCGDEISRKTTTVPALGHTEGEWVIEKHATATETGLKVMYCTVCGDKIAEEVIPVFTTSAELGFYAESVTIEGDVINVAAKLDAVEVDYALALPAGAKVEVVGDATAFYTAGYYWIRSNVGTDSYAIVVTLENGAVINYTVNVKFTFTPYVPEIVAGWSATNVDLVGDVINVSVLKDVEEVDFALVLPYGATVETIGDVEVISAGYKYFRVYYGTETFQIIVTTIDGAKYTYTVNVAFDVTEYTAEAIPGWSAEKVDIDGENITVTVRPEIEEVDFALNIPEGATVVVTEGVEAVKSGPNEWYRVYYGAGLDNFQITITLANGSVYTYYVTVNFSVTKFEAEVLPGWSVESHEVNGDVINVTVRPEIEEVDFALNLPEGATVEVPEGVQKVYDGGYIYLRVNYGGLETYQLNVVLANGKVFTYTVNVTFNVSSYEAEAIPGWSAEKVDVVGENITVVVRENIEEVDFALNIPTGATVVVTEGVESVTTGPNTWYRVTYGAGLDNFQISVTLAGGKTYTYYVTVKFNVNEYNAVATPGWSAETVDVVGSDINVVVRNEIKEVDFALNIPEGATVVVTDGVEAVKSGPNTWYRVYYGAGLDNFEITITLANGAVYKYNVHVTFKVATYEATVMGGWSATDVKVEGNMINVDVLKGVTEVDFALTNLPEGATIVVPEGVQKVYDGGYIYLRVNYGVLETYELTVVLANGTEYTYTVNVKFNVETTETYNATVMGGWSAKNIAVDGNKITVDVLAGVGVVDFAITNVPEGATVTVPAGVTSAFDGHDTWYGVEAGTDYFALTVTLASGVQVVYDVYVNFN